MSYCGIGACVLGFADPHVDEAVMKAIASGSMSTLNCLEEVELAELLCEIHPWANMVRYARCGGEAMALAVRIARAGTGRDKVAFCGYHGWHDWYLSANLSEKDALDGHLIPGQGAGFVRTDYSCTAQCLYGRELPYHGIPSCHPRYTDRHRYGHRNRKSFRDSRYGSCHCNKKHLGRPDSGRFGPAAERYQPLHDRRDDQGVPHLPARGHYPAGLN